MLHAHGNDVHTALPCVHQGTGPQGRDTPNQLTLFTGDDLPPISVPVTIRPMRDLTCLPSLLNSAHVDLLKRTCFHTRWDAA